jgi:transcriptional/translational regulatory protein YebC/TACO1
MKTILPFLFVLFIFSACKKEYSCVCTHPGGEDVVFTVTDNKDRANSKCDDYYNEHFANIPWNETTCEIK